MRRIKHIHMVGIGGSGMSGIAEVLLSLGYKVSGSDISKNQVTERLTQLGAFITYSHVAENVIDCDAIVVSSAINDENIEIDIAKQRRIPIVPRAEMLQELMRFKKGIAVAGTHGKTTTTSMLAFIFAQAGLDPTYVVGGKLNHLGSNAKLGEGEYFIAESDESDASFLKLNPVLSIITNIDKDHMQTYQNDESVLTGAFVQFANTVPFYGLVVACIDDPRVESILPRITRPYITYGFSEKADVRASNWKAIGTMMEFDISAPGFDAPVAIKMNCSGRHNALNALAAFTVALQEGIDVSDIISGLAGFQGVSRRFEHIAKKHIKHDAATHIIDDYGHHPVEVKAVIEAARASYPNKQLLMMFQPHRYTRTKELFEDFVEVLSLVDGLILIDVYSANENPIPGADSKALCDAIKSKGKTSVTYVSNQQDLPDTIARQVQGPSVLLTQGAGSVSKIVRNLVDVWEDVKAAESETI